MWDICPCHTSLIEYFLNGNKENEILNEIVEIFYKRATVHLPRVCRINTPTNILHLLPRVKKTLHESENNVQEKTVDCIPLQNQRIPKNKTNYLKKKEKK